MSDRNAAKGMLKPGNVAPQNFALIVFKLFVFPIELRFAPKKFFFNGLRLPPNRIFKSTK